MKNISNKLKIFISIVSITWIIGASLIYYDAISKYPTRLYSKICSYYDGFHDHFSSVDDPEATQKLHADGIASGKDYSRWTIMKPSFDLFGFLKLILTPLFIGLSILIIIEYRRYWLPIIIKKARQHYLGLMFFTVWFLVLKSTLLSDLTVIDSALLAIAPIIIGILGKYVIYQLVYTIAKAIADAKTRK